jgi:hypothetical protein
MIRNRIGSVCFYTFRIRILNQNRNLLKRRNRNRNVMESKLDIVMVLVPVSTFD